MNNRMLKELQEYYYSLKDSNGYWRKETVGFMYNARTSEDNKEIVRKILTIIMDSDEINTETKVFIASKGINIKGVNELINQARSTKMNKSGTILPALSYNNTCLKLQQDDEALNGYLGNRVLRSIVYDQIEDKKATLNRLKKFKERYSGSLGYRDNLDLRFKPIKPSVTSYANNEEFFDIIQGLEPYLIQRKEIIEMAIGGNEEFVAYFNYLLSKEAIDNDNVKKDRERLIRFLKNEDYISGYEDSSDTDENEDESIIDVISAGISNNGLRKVTNDEVKIDENENIRLSNYTVINYDLERK